MFPVALLGRIGIRLILGSSLFLNAMSTRAEREIRLTVEQEDTAVPLVGASVEFTQYPGQTTTKFTTDSVGISTLPLSEARPSGLRVRVSKDGYVPKLISWNTENPEFQLPGEFTLKLEKARTIGGIVSDQEGRPIAEAKVLIIIRASDSGLSQEIHDDIWERKVTTDESGRWTFAGAPASLKYLHVRLSHPRFVGDELGGRDLKPAEFFDKTARSVMKPGHVIEGTVRDEKGAPLPGVAVLMNQHGAGSTTEPDFATDAQGHYIITNAPEETPGLMQRGVLLAFFKKGFAPEMRIVTTGFKPVKVDVVLPSPARLSGRVVDQKGNPLEGVHVAPDHWRNVRPFGCPWLKTDADGRFLWEDAPADEVVFDLLKEGYLPLRNIPLKAGSEATLTMKRPIAVEASVVDADMGTPIPSFKIMPGVQWSDGRKYLARGSVLPGKDGMFKWSFDEPAHLTGQDGKAIDEGGHFLRIEAPGYMLADSRPIKDVEDSVRLEFKLKKGGEMAFRVLTKEGEPVAGATIAVAGEGNVIQVMNGKIHEGGDWLTAQTDEDGRAVLPAMEGDPKLVVAHPKLGFATLPLDEARKAGITLTGWGRVVVNSPAIQAGKEAPFYLVDEFPSATQQREYPVYYVANRGEVQSDEVLVFEGVRPGKAFVVRNRQPVDRAVEIDVPEGGERTISLPAHEGIANIQGKLVLPEQLAGLDWAQQRGNLQTSPDPKPWPAGLSIEERRKWLDDTPEGRKFTKDRRVYFPEIEADGSYLIGDVAPGQYLLSIPIFSGRQGQNGRRFLGVFQEHFTIPSREELARNMPGNDLNLESLFLQTERDPHFFRCLEAGDRLPEFTAEGVSGERFGDGAVKGKEAILVFYSSIPEQFPGLSDDINEAAVKAKAKGIEIHCLNIDEEKAIAGKLLKQHPLSCGVAWAGDGTKSDLLKKFGPVWSSTVFAVNADGTIRGRFVKATDALADFDR